MTKEISTGAQPKLFFDISGLVDYIEKIDRYSGIQRVVATLISEFSDLTNPDLLYLTWCDRTSGKQLCLPFAALGKESFSSPETMRAYFHPDKTGRDVIPALRRYSDQPMKLYFHRTRLDLASMRGHDQSFRRYNMTAESWKEQRWGSKNEELKTRTPEDLRSVDAAGDLLILLDFAGQPHHIKLFEAAKDRGLVIHSLIYDLIPIVTPHLVPGNAPLQFYDWMLKMMKLGDRFMAISEASRLDTLRFFEAHDFSAPVITVPLAQASVPASPIAEDEVKDEGPLSRAINTEAYPTVKEVAETDENIRQLLSGPFALCVGTIESRKNTWRIAMAWKQLVDAGHENLPRLVFAGRSGALQEDLAGLMQGTGNVYGYVRVLEGPSDEVLDLLYRNCSFTIMASHYEGWGLPVGEALAYGKTAVVADNSSLPEVGGDLVEYCNSQDISSIAKAIGKLSDPSHRAAMEAKVQSANLRTWTDVAKDMQAALQSTDAQ